MRSFRIWWSFCFYFWHQRCALPFLLSLSSGFRALSLIYIVLVQVAKKNTIGWWLEQKPFISHSAGGWEVRDRGAGMRSVWWELSWELSSWFADWRLIAVSSHSGERQETSSLASLHIRASIASCGSGLMTQLSPCAITQGMCEFWGSTNI